MSCKNDVFEDVILDYADYDCCEEAFLSYYGDDEIGCHEEVPYSHGAYTYDEAMYRTINAMGKWTLTVIYICLFIVIICFAFKLGKKVYTTFKRKSSVIEDSIKRIDKLEEMLKEQAKNQEQCNISNTEIVNNTCMNEQAETNNNITPIDDSKETETEKEE